ncbi:hypothetical protein EV356DRAFT_530328 [Viridothelium virens]|uniref:Uncharacterized protein n=1 Tax=Viridothelium virens TaxID=1048519 RepID=A0A6A6HGG0_VIRVR|nr:hypothetical protein EV356DRAFT_530328 [Viridothelium virens]
MSGPPPPPPPPPPHGENPRTASGLPPGNYDIFIIPPHASGSGFLYLPSLQPHRNSFLAGCACTILGMSVWTAIAPALKTWVQAQSQNGGGSGMFVLVLGVGVAAWAFGKTQGETGHGGHSPPPGGGGHGAGSGAAHNHGAGPNPSSGNTGPPPGANGYANTGGFNAGPKPAGSGWQQRQQSTSGAGGAAWEKAREETRRREEERRAREEERKAAEEARKKKEEDEKKAREAAEKEKWEKARAREKEAREREAREKLIRERLAREKAAREADAKEREAREREAKEAKEKEAREKAKRTTEASTTSSQTSPRKKYERPTAKSYVGTEEDGHSFRPYETPPKRPAKTASTSSMYSESSYAPSQTTARTTPPPSHRGPYSTKDPDKIVIKAVYLFNDLFPKPVAQLVSGVGSVTDGLVLKITTEGLFIDDDVRNIGQREWDVKAWGMKLVETISITDPPLHILRASIRDPEGKKYVFILKDEESWKVALGLQRLRRGPLVRSLGSSGLGMGEARRLLGDLGWT